MKNFNQLKLDVLKEYLSSDVKTVDKRILKAFSKQLPSDDLYKQIKKSSTSVLDSQRLFHTTLANLSDEEQLKVVVNTSAQYPIQSTVKVSTDFSHEKVIGKPDMYDFFAWVEKGQKAAKSVCKIETSSGESGTGFIISGGLLMTNNHVIPSVKVADETRIIFNYSINGNDDVNNTSSYMLNPAIFQTSKELDYTIVGIIENDSVPLSEWGYLEFEDFLKPKINDKFTILSHPNGDYLKLSDPDIAIAIEAPYLYHLIDTEEGSSGGPMFNQDWKVVGLHHAGVLDTKHTTEWLKDKYGKIIPSNRGILITEIIKQMDMTTEKITLKELNDLLRKESTRGAAIEKYFYYHESGPMKSEYKLRQEMIITDTTKEGFIGSGLVDRAMEYANNNARKKRLKIYNKRKKDPNRIRIVAEGDSWFQYPKFQYLIRWTKDVKDIIDQLNENTSYAIRSLGAGGDVLRNMFHQKEYMKALEKEDAKILLLSGGGNDFFEVFPNMLQKSKTTSIDGWINANSLKTELTVMKQYYDGLISETIARFPNLKILIHGYDYITPRSKGKWIGKPMVNIGLKKNTDRVALIKYVMDIFNREIEAIANTYPANVIYINLRGTVPQNKNYWHDEIHPNDHGFEYIARKYEIILDGL